MCLFPTYIDNPYYGQWKYSSKRTSQIGFNYLHDCFSRKLVVPCGVCSQCLFLKQQYLLQRVELVSTDHFVFFGTLTYNNASLPHITDSVGNTHYYVDSKHFYHMMHRIRFRKQIPAGCKVIYVEEYGSKRHRPHVHFLLFYPYPANLDFRYPMQVKSFLDKEEKRLYNLFFNEWSVNIGTRKNPVYKSNFTFHEVRKRGTILRNFDFHLVRTESINDITPVPDDYKGKSQLDVAAYVTKYVLKYDEWFRKKQQYLYKVLPPEEYNELIKLIKPRVTISKHFGDSPRYASLVRKGIEHSLSKGLDFKGWKFFSRQSGTYKPLCRYLLKKFLTMDDVMTWWFTCTKPNLYSDSNILITDYDTREHGHDITVLPYAHGCKVKDWLTRVSHDDPACIDEFDF